MEAEAAVGLEGIGSLFTQFCMNDKHSSPPSESVFLATVTNSGDGGLREMAVFCAGPAGEAPDMASPTSLARQVSSFLQAEDAVAVDLRVYAEALDPAAVDVVVGRAKQQQRATAASHTLGTLDSAKLLRVFCRFAACRLGRALEVASSAAGAATLPMAAGRGKQEPAVVAQRVTPLLDECRWKWWRAAVRFS